MAYINFSLHDVARIEIGEIKPGSIPGRDYYHRDIIFHGQDGKKTVVSVFTADNAEGMPVTINSHGKNHSYLNVENVSVTFDGGGIAAGYTHD